MTYKDTDRFIKLFVVPEDIGVRPLSESEIIESLHNIPLMLILRLVAALNAHYYSNHEKDITADLDVVEQYFGEELRNLLQQALAFEKRQFLFHPLQLMHLAKLGLQHCPESGTLPSPGKLLHILLGINEHCEAPFLRKLRLCINEKQERDVFTEFVIRNLCFNHEEKWVHLIGRYYWIFKLLAKVVRRNPECSPINKALRDITHNLELAKYFAVGFGILNRYMSKPERLSDVILVPEYFRLTRLDLHKEIFPILEYLSVSVEEAKKELSARPLSYYDTLLFRRKPLIKVAPERFIVINPSYLAELVTKGIFWQVFDRLQNNKEKYSFADLYGRLLQKYVIKMLRNLLPPKYRIYPAKKYWVGKQEQESTDVAVAAYDKIAFFEVTVGRLRMEDTIIAGDLRAFQEDIRKKVGRKVTQLGKNITEFYAGKLVYEGVSPKDIESVWPAVVVNDHIPLMPLTWEVIEKSIGTAGRFTQPKVMPFRLLDMEELELLAAHVASLSLPS